MEKKHSPFSKTEDEMLKPSTESLKAKSSQTKSLHTAPSLKIGQVSALLKLNSSVLRFWEEEFEELKPMRTPTGQRLYSNQDIALLKKLKKLLYADGLTIEGAKKILQKTPVPKGSKTRLTVNKIPVLSLAEQNKSQYSNSIAPMRIAQELREAHLERMIYREKVSKDIKQAKQIQEKMNDILKNLERELIDIQKTL